MTDSGPVTVGARLRERRQARGLTLTAVAASAGVSKGFLSQLENERTRASVATLEKLAAAVGSTAAELLATPPGVVTTANAPSVHFGGDRATDWLLTPVGLPGFQVLQAEVEPGGSSQYGAITRSETHFVYVFSGSLTLVVNGEERVVGEAESLSFTTPAQYGWHNSTTVAASLLWVTSPPALT